MDAVFVPGLLCSPDLYTPQLRALKHAASIMIADHTRADTMTGIANQILARAPDRFALAGLSMGGYIAFEIMRLAPSRVTRLALLDTSARGETVQQSERRQGLVALARAGRFGAVSERLLPMLIHPDRLGERALTDTIYAMADAVGREAFLRQIAAIIGRRDSRADLAAISCPTLVLVGDSDILTPPEHAREMARGIAGARLEVVPHCGHMSTLEQPEKVSALLGEWLRGGDA